MYEHGYIVQRTSQSQVTWPNFWQPVHHTSLPEDGRVVWAFCPDIGNEDDGFGYVLLARHGRWPNLSPNEPWRDLEGRVIHPTFWAEVLAPQSLASWPTKESAVMESSGARDDVVNSTGPFYRFPKHPGT